MRLLPEVVGVTRARAGLYRATPPDTAGSPDPFWTTITLGLPGLTDLITPGRLPGMEGASPGVTSLLCWLLGTTYTAVADLGTILVLE